MLYIRTVPYRSLTVRDRGAYQPGERLFFREAPPGKGMFLWDFRAEIKEVIVLKQTDFSLNWYRRTGDKRNHFFAPPAVQEGKKPKPFVFGPFRAETIPDDAEKVDLPDDFIISLKRDPDSLGGGSNAFYPGDMAKYWKNLHIGSDMKDQKVILYLDGSYMNTEVRVNGFMTEHHPYGYTPWQFDLTPYVHEGDNVIRVDVQSRQPSTRWYSGGGIFREVRLLTGGKVYINPWDFFVTTPVAGPVSTVRVEAQVTSDRKEAAQAKIVLKVNEKGGKEAARAEASLSLIPGGKTPFAAEISVPDAKLWDVDDPNLYELTAQVLIDGKEADTAETTFGIRSIEIDAKEGFRLNGKKMKLYGGCCHHDNGALGARSLRAAEERKVRAMKEVGYNAIRTAHNPASSVLLDVCDELGMLILEETFDCWTEGKNVLDYHLYFNDWWQRDTEAMLRRDRNHPCIWCWSIGNEIMEIGKTYGVKYSQMQADCMRAVDPTRPVMSALNGMAAITSDEFNCEVDKFGNDEFDLRKGKSHYPAAVLKGESDPWGDRTAAAAAVFDVVGQNYMHRRLAHDGAKFPGRVIATTESKPTDSYDAWHVVWENPHVIGDFIWTAFDNLGEAGMGQILKPETNGIAPRAGWPWLNCLQGDFDLIFERKPQSYYRALVWGIDKGTHLYSNPPEWGTGRPWGNGWGWEPVIPSWTWDESWLGDPCRVVAYTVGDEAEFLLNGKSIARVPVERFCAEAVVPYEPGRLEVIAYEKGVKVGSDCLETTGEPVSIRLEADRTSIRADGFDLSFVKIWLADSKGRRVYTHSRDLQATVSGAGVLEGLGSGNPCTEENFNTGHRRTYKGALSAIVRSNREKGRILLTVAAPGLPAETIELTAK